MKREANMSEIRMSIPLHLSEFLHAEDENRRAAYGNFHRVGCVAFVGIDVRGVNGRDLLAAFAFFLDNVNELGDAFVAYAADKRRVACPKETARGGNLVTWKPFSLNKSMIWNASSS